MLNRSGIPMTRSWWHTFSKTWPLLIVASPHRTQKHCTDILAIGLHRLQRLQHNSTPSHGKMNLYAVTVRVGTTYRSCIFHYPEDLDRVLSAACSLWAAVDDLVRELE